MLCNCTAGQHSRPSKAVINLPLLFLKVQLTPVAFVATATASTPPVELVTAYVRVALLAAAQAVAVAGPFTATLGLCCAVKAVTLVTFAVHPVLSMAVRVTANSGQAAVALRLRQETVTGVGEFPFTAAEQAKGAAAQDRQHMSATDVTTP
jgi:hypothetical protein